MIKKIIVSMAVSLSAFGASASLVTLSSTGQGFCTFDGCNNLGSGWHSSTLVGGRDAFRNWFSFQIGQEKIESATLRIWNAYGPPVTYNTQAKFDIYASDRIEYASLRGVNSLGSLYTSGLDNSQSSFIDIILNSEGVKYINQNMGREIIFGGSMAEESGQLFRYTNGLAKAQLDTISTVPEPKTLPLLFVGMMAIALIRRDRMKYKKCIPNMGQHMYDLPDVPPDLSSV